MYFEVQERVLPRPLGMYFRVHRRDQNRPTPSVVPSPPTIRRPSKAPVGRPIERDEQMGQSGLPLTSYCRLPSGAPQSGQTPARPAVLPSPTTPNPAFTTSPSAAVRLIPRCWASSPNWSQSSSSRRMWASCLDISNLGRGAIRKAYYLCADHERTLYHRMWYASGMTKQSVRVGAAILAAGGLVLASCGTSVATPPAGKTICSRQGGWCLVLHRTLTSAAVTVTCPVRTCSEATIALRHASPGQAYPGPEVREGVPTVTPGPHVTVAPAALGITCNATLQAAIGGWCMSPGSTTHYTTKARLKDPAVTTPTIACAAGTCQGGWAVVATGTAPGRPWSLTLPLPAIRVPREMAA